MLLIENMVLVSEVEQKCCVCSRSGSVGVQYICRTDSGFLSQETVCVLKKICAPSGRIRDCNINK